MNNLLSIIFFNMFVFYLILVNYIYKGSNFIRYLYIIDIKYMCKEQTQWSVL